MIPAPTPRKLYVIAGEASGDLHGANLIAALRAASNVPLEIYGVGGVRIKAAGALNFIDIAHFHVTGITDAIKRYPDYKRAAAKILADIGRARPEVVVLIDNPGFNLYLARRIAKMGIPIVYYIAPQVWAWNAKRIEIIKRTCAKVLVVFEFERPIYLECGIPVEWVGHPLKDLTAAPAGAAAARALLAPKSRRLVALLPGSRKGEVKMLFKTFLAAARRLSKRLPDTAFFVLKSPTLPRSLYQRLIVDAGKDLRLSIVEEDHYSAIRAADVAVVCSGTATLECALLGTPLVISNKGTLLTYVMARALVKVPYLGLPNLVLNAPRFPELLQYDATPEKIAAAAETILTQEDIRERMKRDLAEVSERLGPPGATERAAQEVLKLLA